MKITGHEILYANAGWRNACFLKITTDDGLVGWSEFSEHTGTAGISGVVRELSNLIKGMNPIAIETIAAFLRGRTMQAGGGMNQHAIAAIVNALFDIKGKALNTPVHTLFGGPVRDRVPAYWSHCGSYRIRHGAMVGKPPVKTFDDIVKLGAEARDLGFKALKTGMVTWADGAFANFGPGFAFTPGWPAMNVDRLAIDTTVKMMEAFREGAGPEVALALDLNFHFKTEGYLEVIRALKDFNLLWLEIDTFDPKALSRIRSAAHFPIASLEALFFRQGLKPYLDEGCADIGIIDVTWNGYLESVKMADYCAAYEVNVASHAYCAGGLADVMSAHFAAAVPNFRIMEYDYDDVPWKPEFLTNPLVVKNSEVIVPQGPGWGCDVNEAALKKFPVK